MDQALSLAEQANVDIYLDNKILAITPPNTPRGTIIPELSPSSGNVGYPTFDSVSVNLQTLFNPAIKQGGLIKLVTSVKAINNISTQWIVTSMSHTLESEKAGGAWFTNLTANQNGKLTAGQ
jgi:hypothetical protein